MLGMRPLNLETWSRGGLNTTDHDNFASEGYNLWSRGDHDGNEFSEVATILMFWGQRST